MNSYSLCDFQLTSGPPATAWMSKELSILHGDTAEQGVDDHGEQFSLPLALCWVKYWPLKNLHVELSPLQTPQASNTALEPSPWSHPTCCNQKAQVKDSDKREFEETAAFSLKESIAH